MSFEVVIHAERCKGCGLCIALCPTGILAVADHLNASGVRPVVVLRMEDCRGCRQCAIICPEAAITIFRLSEPSPTLSPAIASTLAPIATPDERRHHAPKEPDRG